LRRTFLLALAALLLAAPLAAAHANYASSDPPANGHASYGVTEVTINFSEQVERRYTDADVFDLQGNSVKAGPVAFDAQKASQIHVPVSPLRDGLYSVSWKSLSVDSHTAEGAFIFAVGNATVQVPIDPNAAHDHAAGDVVKDGFARAVYYAGMFFALGIPFFLLVVDRDAGMPRGAFVTVALFGLLGAAAALLNVLFLAQRTALSFLDASQTDAGLSFLWRGILLGASALCALVAALAPGARRVLGGAGILFAAGSLVAASLGSHASADQQLRGVSLAADMLHLAMGAVWVGGLVGFLHTVWGRTAQQVAAVVLRFTPWALASVGVLLATGIWASWRHVPAWSDLWNDPYGRLVSLKVLLLGVLVLIGAYNKEVLGPRMRRGATSPAFFRRVVQVEALTMVCVLAAAGVLASTAPPEGAANLSIGPQPYLELSNVSKTTHVVLQISPNPPVVGLQKLAVTLHPLSAADIPSGTDVAIKVAKAGAKEPSDVITLQKVNEQTWSGEDTYFSSVGTWRVWVLLQRPDEFAKLTFDVDVKAPS
jgi:copper transport protein